MVLELSARDIHSNTLLNSIILDCIKLKAFSDAILKGAKNTMSFFYRIENIVGKREYSGNQNYFFHFPTMFSKGFFHKIVKSQDCVLKS